MAVNLGQSPKNWTESEVSTWLASIGVEERYIKTLFEEEVDGQILLTLNEDFLKTKICMKSGPAHLILQKRDELINSVKSSQEKTSCCRTELEQWAVPCPTTATGGPLVQIPDSDQNVLKKRQTAQKQCVLTSKKYCRPRPFDQEGVDFKYIKHTVLQPKSDAFDLMTPCREFMSFAVAATFDRTRFQAKFAREVLKFATGCMNSRSNGTIHFGVMDGNEDAGYVHGEIIGIPVKKKIMYADAFKDIKKNFSSYRKHVHQCVRPPRFIQVMDRKSTEKRYVVEVDIVPSISIVKSRVYAVCLPNFNESENNVEFEKETILRRVGSKTEPVSDKDLDVFQKGVKDRDAQREEAEKTQFLNDPNLCQDNDPNLCQDLGRKLTMLMASGKKFIEKDKWFILVTNKFKPDDLPYIDWLLNMNIFCVFDFDPDSKVSGLCSKYLQHRTANIDSLQGYWKIGETNSQPLINLLHNFKQTSWIFCNGRNDLTGSKILMNSDEITLIKKKKKTDVQKLVSMICKQFLPKGTLQVIFLLNSPVSRGLLNTFNHFFTEMEGPEDIICICESKTNFQNWQSFVEGSCGREIVNHCSVVGMKMKHIDATLQQVQPKKHLSVFMNGTCLLETQAEEQMNSLEILTVGHCDETSKDFIDEEKANIEHQFYSGGRVTWLNFWLAEHREVGEVIERDAYGEVSYLLHALQWNADESPVKSVNIFHHPGSGGSTVARQVLWNNRKNFRCAVVKPSHSAAVVAQHAIKLREYGEKGPRKCHAVLLLIEDSNKEYLDDLRNELEVAIHTKKIQLGTLCFILLSCRRSYDPEKRRKESLLQNVSVTHRLSPQEKRKFSGKREALEAQKEPEFILTFVLMSEGFNPHYIQQFVEHLLQGIDRGSVVTRLILYVALLNTYVHNSFISQSHCEAFLAVTNHSEGFQQHDFEKSLSPQAKLVFLQSRDDKTLVESIRIKHPLIAKEILKQLLGDQQSQSSVAMDLLCENVLFKHRLGRNEYLSFLKALFIRRLKISEGDRCDTFFSPLIEHVCEKEKSPDKAMELLEKAFELFNNNPFLAQQLARLHYTYEKFEEARHWAETAAKQQPNNSYILDTKGQVYRKWFQAKCKDINNNNIPKTPENIPDAVETALEAIVCFQQRQDAAVTDMKNGSNLGYVFEVEVGCSLLKLISSSQVFGNKEIGHSECVNYLLTDYIPEEVEDAWAPFHGCLKKLRKTMRDALEGISEDLSYFQTDIGTDEEETLESTETRDLLTWLPKKSEEYGKYFSEVDSTAFLNHEQSIPANLTPSQKRMIIYQLGGGNFTSILSKITDQREAVPLLETILSLYPRNPKKAKFGQMDIVSYIVANIALNCLSPGNQNVAPLRNLQALCRQFPSDKTEYLPSALFLLTLLFWPDDDDTDQEREDKYEIVQSAVEHLDKKYQTKKKDIPQRKRRIYSHFFLVSGTGLDKFVHKKKFESVTKEISEKHLKWSSGEAWKIPGIAKMLKRVSGWTEDGMVYLEGPQKKRLNIQPLHLPSVPRCNVNISFYLGFTFRGPVACNIVVQK